METIEEADSLANALDEFKDAIPLNKFHRFAVVLDTNGKAKNYFGLLDEAGVNHYFSCDPKTVANLFHEFHGLAVASQSAEKGERIDHVIVPFETNTVSIQTLYGHEKCNGTLIFHFLTPTGHTLETIIGPDLATTFASSLDTALSLLPTLPSKPKGGFPGVKTPGKKQATSDTSTFFNQQYPNDILKAFGLLLIRSNLLESQLVELLAILSKTDIRNAAAIFFSSANAKARIDLIRAQLSVCGLDEKRIKDIDKILKKVRKVSEDRNELVHGTWVFEGNKFKVTTYRPALSTANKEKTVLVDSNYILELAKRYNDVGMKLMFALNSLRCIPI